MYVIRVYYLGNYKAGHKNKSADKYGQISIKKNKNPILYITPIFPYSVLINILRVPYKITLWPQMYEGGYKQMRQDMEMERI